MKILKILNGLLIGWVMHLLSSPATISFHAIFTTHLPTLSLHIKTCPSQLVFSAPSKNTLPSHTKSTQNLKGMASMTTFASSTAAVKATPFLGQPKNANPLRDVVSMGNAKYTMVRTTAVV